VKKEELEKAWIRGEFDLRKGDEVTLCSHGKLSIRYSKRNLTLWAV
jgi:hypothetical protein